MGLAIVGRYILAAMFFRSGLAKMSSLPEFRSAVANYRLLPMRVVSAVALSLPFAEVAAATLVATGVLTSLLSAVMALLLITFATAIAINLARGRVFDCGCAGRAAPRLITWRHVGLNVAMALTAAAVALASPASLAAWPGPAPFALRVPRGDAIPVLLAVVVGLITAVAVQRTVEVSRLVRLVKGNLRSVTSALDVQNEAPRSTTH